MVAGGTNGWYGEDAGVIRDARISDASAMNTDNVFFYRMAVNDQIEDKQQNVKKKRQISRTFIVHVMVLVLSRTGSTVSCNAQLQTTNMTLTFLLHSYLQFSQLTVYRSTDNANKIHSGPIVI